MRKSQLAFILFLFIYLFGFFFLLFIFVFSTRVSEPKLDLSQWGSCCFEADISKTESPVVSTVMMCERGQSCLHFDV